MNFEAEILTIAALVIPFGRLATSHTNNPTRPLRYFLLRQNATNPHKCWNTSSKSTRMFEKYLSSAISTFMSDPDLNSQNKRQSSNWALPTIAALSRFNLYMPSHSAPIGLLLRFLKSGFRDAILVPAFIELRLWSSDKTTPSCICSPLLILVLYDELATDMYYFVRVVRCTGANSLIGPIVMRAPQ